MNEVHLWQNSTQNSYIGETVYKRGHWAKQFIHNEQKCPITNTTTSFVYLTAFTEIQTSQT